MRRVRSRAGVGVLLAITCLTTLMIAPASARTTCSNETGTNEGYYYTHWSDGVGSACMTPGTGGNYSYSWSNSGNFVGGKGWSAGRSDRVVSYDAGAYSPSGNSYLTLYGWSTGSCGGGSSSEWLHCNGSIGYGDR